jgi:hypothetical protein
VDFHSGFRQLYGGQQREQDHRWAQGVACTTIEDVQEAVKKNRRKVIAVSASRYVAMTNPDIRRQLPQMGDFGITLAPGVHPIMITMVMSDPACCAMLRQL